VVEIKTSCAHCGDPIELIVDSDLKYGIARGGPSPLVFEPDVNWNEFKDPTIIDGY